MKRRFLVEKVVGVTLDGSLDFARRAQNYRRFRILLCALMLVVAMGPVLVVAGFSYGKYTRLIWKNEQEQLHYQLEGSITAIDQMLDGLKSVILFVARRDRYTELVGGDTLEKLFVRLERQYPFFADLGVIDQQGVQRAYFGPYDLQDAVYSDEKWFKIASDSGVYISNVYMGYRGVAHFSVAVSNLDPKTRQNWVLRATIEAITLQQFVNSIATDAYDDLFLMDTSGILQTPSSFFGKTLGRIDNELLANGLSRHGSLIHEGENYFFTIGEIKNTPWSLVLIRKHYAHHREWQSFRRNLYFFVGACLVISVLLVFSLVSVFTGILREADEIRAAIARKAEHTDKLASIGRLAAGVGHEINNPLAIINEKTGLMSDLLQISGDFEHKSTFEQSLKVVNQSVERCKTITHRLLGFARRGDISLVPVNINDVIREVFNFLGNSMTYNRIKLELKLEDNLPQLLSDRVQLQQILLNILNNAIDAIGKDGTISISTSMLAGDIQLILQDDGPGIDEDVLPYIFEPFFTTKETGKGTGLGLSITYGLVKKLGGDISVRSKKGVGTAFTLNLPVESETDGKEKT